MYNYIGNMVLRFELAKTVFLTHNRKYITITYTISLSHKENVLKMLFCTTSVNQSPI